jgi:hypothetical protein
MSRSTVILESPETATQGRQRQSGMSFANALIQKLVPKDKRFYPLFESFGETVEQASSSFYKLVQASDAASREAYAKEVFDAEEKGDSIIHTIVTELTATFLTPFDREDIHRLASTLDSILDELNSAARRIVLYNVEVIPDELLAMGRDIDACGSAASAAMHELKSIHNPKSFAAKIKTIQVHKSQGDETFLRGMAALYDGGYDQTFVLKMREILYASDNALRFFQELSFALEAVLIKTT